MDTSNSTSVITKSAFDKAREPRPSTPLFRDECLESECNTPTNQSYDSTTLNDSVVVAKSHQNHNGNNQDSKSVCNSDLNYQEGKSTTSHLIVVTTAAVAFEKRDSTNQAFSPRNIEPTNNSRMDDPVDEIPISRGNYTLDFDSLDNINPFQTSKGLRNSPDLPSKPFPNLPQSSLPEHETADTNNHIIANDVIANPSAMDDVVLAKVMDVPHNHSTNLPEKVGKNHVILNFLL